MESKALALDEKKTSPNTPPNKIQVIVEQAFILGT
jgi:hypothetical protein